MGVLYDGAQYLIGKKTMRVATAPLAQFVCAFAPLLSSSEWLRGGIGLPQIINGQSFPPI